MCRKWVLFAVPMLILHVPALCQTLSSQPELKKPMTLAVKGEALSGIMDMLERQTGVRLRVTKDIADQKATIFVDEKPLSEVMGGLSKLFGYKWRLKTFEDKKSYELFRDPKSVVSSGYEQAVAKAFGELDAEFRGRKDAWGDIYRSMTPRQLQWFREGYYLYFDSESVEPEWRLADVTARDLIGPHDREGKVEGVSVAIRCSCSQDGIRNSASLSGRRRHVNPSTGESEVAMFTLDVGALPWRKLPDKFAQPEVILPQQPDSGLLARKATMELAELAKEAAVSWQPLGGSSVWANRSDVLALLHKKLGVQIISDHYSRWYEWSAAKDRPLKYVLDEHIGKRLYMDYPDSGCVWGWDGKLLYMRARDFFRADLEEIPNRLLRRWQAACKQLGYLGLDMLGEIALTDEEQLSSIRNLDNYYRFLGLAEVETDATCGISGDMKVLKVYGLLNSVQRRLALSTGVSFGSLNNEQLLAVGECLALGDGIPRRSDGIVVGAYWKGVRVDKPEPPGPDSPVLLSIVEAEPEVEVYCKVKDSSARGYELRPSGHGHTVADAVSLFHTAWPGIGDDRLLTQKRAMYKAVFMFANGKTFDRPFGVAMNLVPVKSD